MFGKRLQELREQKGMSQADLAKASGVPRGTIQAYEQGRRQPLWDVLFRLARALKVSCEAFADCVPAEPVSGKKPAKRAGAKPKS